MEKHITVNDESVETGLQIEADKGTRITNQVENNLGAVKSLNDDEDIDEDMDDELTDDENITEEEVIVEEDVDEDEDLDDEDDDDEDE